MAIDTQEKRRSTLQAFAYSRILPVATGTIGAQEREHMYVYSGIPAAAPPAPGPWTPKVGLAASLRRRRLLMVRDAC